MALVNYTIHNLTNGVSQQPVTVRLPDQSQEQINTLCRVTDGLIKRPPSELKKRIQESAFASYNFQGPMNFEDCKFYTFKRQDENSGVVYTYTLIIHAVSPKGRAFIYNHESATMQPLYIGANPSDPTSFEFEYLNKNANRGIEDIEVLDTGTDIYIYNKKQNVYLTGSPDLSPDDPKDANAKFVTINQFYEGAKYSLSIKKDSGSVDKVVSITMPSLAANSSNVDDIIFWSNPVNIVERIGHYLTTTKTPTQTTDWTGTDRGATVFISNSASTIYDLDLGIGYTNSETIAITGCDQRTTNEFSYVLDFFCTAGQRAYRVINGAVTTTADLPRLGQINVPNTRVKIKTLGDDETTAIYVKWNPKTETWEEACSMNASNFGWQYLPLVLKYDNELNTWKIFNMVIDDITAGDLTSNKRPSFVGNPITHMFIYQNRLGILSRDNVIMSQIDEHSSFFKTTMMTNLASDRIDLQGDLQSEAEKEFIYSLTYNRDLLLFTKNRQYILSSQTGVLTPATANLALATKYASSDKAFPIVVGNTAYFTNKKDKNSLIFSLQQVENIDAYGAINITQHIPSYIKGNVLQMVYNPTEEIVFIRTDEEKDTIYVQNRFVDGTTLKQNAWQKWVLPFKILDIAIFENTLQVIMLRTERSHPNSSDLYITNINTSGEVLPQDSQMEISFLPFLDCVRKWNQYSILSHLNTFPEKDLVGVDAQGFKYEGLDDINEALEKVDLWVGIRYKMSYTFSEQVPAQFDQQGKKTPMLYGKLRLKTFKLNFSQTKSFKVKIKPEGRQEFEAEYSGIIANSEDYIIGKVNLTSGQFKFPVHSLSDSVKITVESDTPYPCTFNTCEWQGVLINKSGRL